MGPGLYSDIGKRARDLLYKDYLTDQKFVLTTYTANGVAITATATRRNELIFAEIQSQLRNKNLTVDVKANSDSSVLTTVTVDELATPGLKSVLTFAVPDPKSGKVELQYLHDHAGVSAAFGLNTNPIINLAGVLGTKALAVGADAAFDTAAGNFTKYNAGMSITGVDFITSFTLNEKGDQLSASYYHLVNPSSSTAVGAELIHRFSTAENTLTFGTQHALDPLTMVKARVDNYGKASALIQHEWRPKSFVIFSTEVDTKAIEKSSKVGLSLVLRP
ncbi:Mitochondrial outer membrane protein porin 1 [Apostasia shenzhenica]|uniref:Mitochondrial outer membrane protein porin 1 n=1 Tax=Apostasia shenzhenica TaxID=1088818 RepID=A0A2H9ZU51_9ASPA|nr:Mitochondrial outer membrane protein porin 1 [Apostasia shenzhenica]